MKKAISGIKEFHLFAGNGGGIYDGELLGHKCCAGVEIDGFCKKIFCKTPPYKQWHLTESTGSFSSGKRWQNSNCHFQQVISFNRRGRECGPQCVLWRLGVAYSGEPREIGDGEALSTGFWQGVPFPAILKKRYRSFCTLFYEESP